MDNVRFASCWMSVHRQKKLTSYSRQNGESGGKTFDLQLHCATLHKVLVVQTNGALLLGNFCAS